jgi:hypothetical protein
MTWVEGLKLLASYIPSIGFIFTSAIAWKIYKRQREDADDRAEKQSLAIQKQVERDARARITQAYFQFNAEILRSTDNINVTRDLMYAQYNSNDTRHIIYMYLVLNTLHLEWKYYKDHGHPKNEFIETLDKMIGSIAKNLKSRDNLLIKDFEKIFCDFPQEFKEEVRDCINRHIPPDQHQ